MKTPTWESSPGALLTLLSTKRRSAQAHLVTVRLSDGTLLRWTDWSGDLAVNGKTFRAPCPTQGRYVPPIPPPVVVSQWYMAAGGVYWRDGVTGGPIEADITATTNGSVITHQHDSAPGYCRGVFLVGSVAKFSGVEVGIGNPVLGTPNSLPLGARSYDIQGWCARGSPICAQGVTAGTLLAASPSVVAGGSGTAKWGNSVQLTAAARTAVYSNVHLTQDPVMNAGPWTTFDAGYNTYWQGPGMPSGSPGWSLVPMSGSGQILFDASGAWVKGWPLVTAPPQSSYEDLYWALVTLDRPIGTQSWWQNGGWYYRSTPVYGLVTANISGVVQ